MKRIKEAEGTGRSPALRWLFSIGFLVLWALAVGTAALYFAARALGHELFYSYFELPLLLLLNLLPGVLLALLVFALTNRVWPAVLLSGAVIIAGGVAEFFKMQTRSEPLLAGDLRYVSEAANISARYDLTPTPAMLACIAALVIATVLALLLCKARFRRVWPRLLLLALVLAVGALSYFGLYRSASVYEKTANYDVKLSQPPWDPYRLNMWSEGDRFYCRGFWYPFLNSTAELGDGRPKGYDAAEAAAQLASYPGVDLTETQKVSFISIMLEAYADFSVYPQLTFETDPYETFHALQAEGVSGLLDVNIFAGGTIDTERCYLSGSTEQYDYRRPADSFVRWFAAQGYRTEFCHPGLRGFYNRENVAEYLGFDRSYFGETYYPVVDRTHMIMDAQFFPSLVELLHDAAAEGKPYFNMSVTYQNHGPYPTTSLYDSDTIYVRGDMSEESSIILNNYFWGIARTDEALRELTDTLRGDPEPVVLVLFGDHKPWLGDKSSVYSDVGIDLRYWEAESNCEYCRTPWLIWANDAAKAQLGRDFTGDGGEISPCYLMLKVFDACGFEGDAYMHALRAACPELEMLSPRLKIYRSRGVFATSAEELPEAVQEVLNGLRRMSYYRMRSAVR